MLSHLKKASERVFGAHFCPHSFHSLCHIIVETLMQCLCFMNNFLLYIYYLIVYDLSFQYFSIFSLDSKNTINLTHPGISLQTRVGEFSGMASVVYVPTKCKYLQLIFHTPFLLLRQRPFLGTFQPRKQQERIL